MGSAICLSADRERALRETPAALSLLVSLSTTEDLSRLGAIIILALISLCMDFLAARHKVVKYKLVPLNPLLYCSNMLQLADDDLRGGCSHGMHSYSWGKSTV